MSRKRWLVVAIAALHQGCGWGGEDVVADAHVPRLTGEITQRIGLAEGDARYLFGRIGGIGLDPDGRIYVADAQADEVRAFSAHGDYLYTIGRSGAGPGELSRPCCIAFDPRGRLWVRDVGNSRYNGYQPGMEEAQYLGTVRMAHGDPNYAATLTFAPDGRLVDVGHRTDPATGQRRLVRFHLDAEGTVVREEVIEPPSAAELGARTIEVDGGRSQFFFYPPFGPNYLLAHSSSGHWAEALSSRPEVRWFGPGGVLNHIISREDIEGPPLTAGERETAETRLADQLSSFGTTAAAEGLRTPDRKPPLQALFFDELGRLWVQRSVEDGEENVADVYSLDGVQAAQVRWPRGVRLNGGFILEEEALGIAVDELGAPQVVRLRFEEG